MNIPLDKSKTGEKKFEGKRQSRNRGSRVQKQEDQEFDQKIIDVARVTRVTEGGKQMSFRATVAIGDRKGRVGIGIGKGLDVSDAINKGVAVAKKDLAKVPINKEGTIPHKMSTKFGAAKIMIQPAPQGTGIIAGGVMRIILELAGIKDVVAKMHGSRSKINNSKATMVALRSLQIKMHRNQNRGIKK